MTAAAAPAPLDLFTVRRKLADVRALLVEARQLLGELYEGRAWVALELPSWEALCRQELPELAQLLTMAEKRALVVDLRRRGLSLRAAAAPAGVSAPAAKKWADAAGVQLAAVVSLDGRTRPAEVAAHRPRRTTVARLLALAGEGPITVHDATRRLRINQCAASAHLSRLAADGRLTYRRPAKRGQVGTYVLGEVSS